MFWLRERHGSIRAVATLLQFPEAEIFGKLDQLGETRPVYKELLETQTV